MRDKYCCFLHPAKDYDEKELEDCCPYCEQAYGFPLDKAPAKVGIYKIIKPVGRGFYGATYQGVEEKFGRSFAVKVIPKSVYAFFKKDFSRECQEHFNVAENTEHLAPITDYFDEDVRFGELTIPCHVAIMRWVDGDTLFSILNTTSAIPATEIAQFAIDLISLLEELQRQAKRHNDLHGKNIIIERTPNAPHRIDRIHSHLRAIAVDFGSIHDNSQSGGERLGDLAHVGRHMENLTSKILRAPVNEEDLNWRLAFALSTIANLLSHKATSQRNRLADLKAEIFELSRHRARTPVWNSALELKAFSEHYNALTIESAYVPNLLVLPPGTAWFDSLMTPGPQVIYGMRGCGKTMLLKSIDFHARAFKTPGESVEDVVSRLKTDGFVGLFLSCAKLLNPNDRPGEELHITLLMGYALCALRVAQNLRDIDRTLVDPQFANLIAGAVTDALYGIDLKDERMSEHKLEETLVRLQLNIQKDAGISLAGSPANVFPMFASVFAKIAPTVFNKSRILFLLDDVSTRFISEDAIADLISALVFSNEYCAFKFTTEAQTLELVLKSPGRIEKASSSRDYKLFDLGAEVSRLVRAKGNNGRKFVSDILARRSQYYPRHPKVDPKTVLGDQKLSVIAESIGRFFDDAERRKRTYWGLTALSSLCVGDVGEIIRLYEDIVSKSNSNEFPIKPDIQQKCFQHISHSALYELSRRDSKLKNHALGFANAAHKLLRQSYHLKDNKRIRQYAQVYVSISQGDEAFITKELTELIDAGVYVLDAVTTGPRTKRHATDPIKQFILTYRKIHGIAIQIGLAYRDRFELSGNDLAAWLKTPEKAEEILIRNQSTEEEAGEDEAEFDADENTNETSSNGKTAIDPQSAAVERFLDFTNNSQPTKADALAILENSNISVDISIIQDSDLLQADILIAGFGFEERCEESVRRLIARGKFGEAIMAEYDAVGRTANIRKHLKKQKLKWTTIPYGEEMNKWSLPNGVGSVLVDVSGLTKPAIFHICRAALENGVALFIAHTEAAQYFPSDEEIAPLIMASDENDPAQLLQAVSNLFKGEEGPYNTVPLLENNSDCSRQRALLAFASAKHERLQKLLDQRHYDFLGVSYSDADNRRAFVSKLAGQFAVGNVGSACCCGNNPTSLSQNLEFLTSLYNELYLRGGYNVEVGLTGAKMSAVATAIIASKWKLSQVWHVRPSRYNSSRFTKGVANTVVYRIKST